MKKQVIVAVSVVAIAVILFLIMHNYRNSYHEKIAALPQKYCYDDFSGVINPAFYVESKSETEELIKFYKQIEQDPSATPPINFSIRGLPQRQPVYVMSYQEPDSLIAEIYCYYKFGAIYDGNIHGYVYAKTLHDNKPE